MSNDQETPEHSDEHPDEQPTLDTASEAPTRPLTPASAPPPSTSRPERVGPYEVVEVLGEGGMGVVYRAAQESPRREVALKLIRPGMVTGSLLRRFQLEADILARLQHPGIAQVYQAGLHDGAPYFAMELIEGQTLVRHARQNKLSTKQRLELFGKICDAVQHAHQKGVIHRDLKPGNILVDQSGQPKILDFGVARATDGDIQTTTIQTNVGQLIGTVQYMSPEQAGGDPEEIDTRSDVYALGVILYELLAEQLPYDLSKKMVHEAVRVIREDDPTRLSMIQKTLRGDIETIVGKAMEKDKDRRYQSASALAADVGRYLGDEPISARPPSSVYQLRKFTKRNKALVVGVAAVFVVLVAGIIGTGVALDRALDAEGLAQERLVEANAARDDEAAQRAIAEQRADELKLVSEFQSEQLGAIDAEAMGAQLRESILAETPEESRAALADSMSGVNFTNIALGTLEEIIFIRTIDAVDAQFEDQPLVRARLLQAVADTAAKLDLLDIAVGPQKRALAIRRAEHGDDHLDTLYSITNTGVLLQLQGKYAETQPYFTEALDGYQRMLGDESPETLVAVSNMGALLHDMGRLDEAEPYYLRALETSRRTLGNNHPRTLDSINNMGFLLNNQGKLDEAEAYFRESLEALRRTQGDDHPTTLTSINNIAVLLRKQGKLSEAEPYYVEALERRRRVQGDDHQETLSTLNNFGFLLNDLGRFDEAERHFRQALEGRQRVLGDDHPDTLNGLNNIGYVLHDRGKLDEAEEYFRLALEGRQRVLGADHHRTLGVVNNLAYLLVDQDRLQEAEAMFRRSFDGHRRIFGDDHVYTLNAAINLAQVLADLGDGSAGLVLIEGAVASGPQTLGADAALSGNLRSIRGRALLALERYTEAEAAMLEAYEILVNAIGESHEDTKNVARSLAALYDEWDEAEPGAGHDVQADRWRGIDSEQD